MSDFDADISDLYLEMARFLKTQARQEDTKSQPLTLRTEYKTSLKLTDSEKQVFEVDESFLSAFRDIYTDKGCTSPPIQTRPSDSTTGSSRSSSSARSAPASISSQRQSPSSPPEMPTEISPPATSRSPSSSPKPISRSSPLKFWDISIASANATSASSPTMSTRR